MLGASIAAVVTFTLIPLILGSALDSRGRNPNILGLSVVGLLAAFAAFAMGTLSPMASVLAPILFGLTLPLLAYLLPAKTAR